MVSLDGIAISKPTGIRFREVWDATHAAASDPKIGLCRFIVLADTDEEAKSLARMAYDAWNVTSTFSSS